MLRLTYRKRPELMKFRRIALLLFLLTFILLPTPSGWADELSSTWDREGISYPGKLNITVYKDPACRCCDKWIQHLAKHGFQVKAVETAEMDQIKQQVGLPENLTSCHTGIIDQHVIEGHVPADDIKQLMQQKSAIAGLSVPQMPVGTPGMETPDGQQDPFTVFSYDQHRATAPFKTYS